MPSDRTRRLRAWLTTPPKATRFTIAAYWVSGNGLLAVLRYVPQHPTVEVLNWVIAAAVVGLAVYLGYIAITNRRRRR